LREIIFMAHWVQCPIGSMFPLKWEIVPMFPLKWEIVPMFPLKWVAVTESPFPRPPKDFFRLYTQWVIFSESPDSFTPSSRLVVAILLNCGNMDTLRKGKP